MAVPVLVAGIFVGVGPSSALGPLNSQIAPGLAGNLILFSDPQEDILATERAEIVKKAALTVPEPATAQALIALMPEHDPNEKLRFGPVSVSRDVVETVVRAGEKTNVDPVYLMALADKESSFKPDAKAPTSSAEGMFQFIDRTWLSVVKEFGPAHGLVDEAGKIEVVDDKPTVDSSADRERILAIRRDPYISAVMAAEMLKRDREDIQGKIGRDLRTPEYYIFHFLGYEGGSRFMQTLVESPQSNAVKLFPAAAKANRTIFYTRQGRKLRGKTVAEVYAFLSGVMDTRLDRYTPAMRMVRNDGAQAMISDKEAGLHQ